MTHEDWLWLIEFHTRNGNLEESKNTIAAMRKNDELKTYDKTLNQPS